MADADTEARILEVADQLFGERGYDAVSMRDVAEAAGVNKALVFYYFRSKERLFDHVLRGYYDEHVAAFEQAFVQPGPIPDRLHRLIDAYLDFVDRNRRYPRLVQQQVAGSGTHLEPIERNLAQLLRWTEQALAELAPEEGPRAARHFFVTFSGAVINYFTYAPVLEKVWGRDPLSPDAIVERRAHLHWMVDALIAAL